MPSLFKKMLCVCTLLSYSHLIHTMQDPHILFAQLSIEVASKDFDPEQIKVEMGAQAASHGDLESLRNFINSSNVNKLTNYKLRVFHHAILFAEKSRNEAQYQPIFDYLLSQGAEIQNQINGEKMPPVIFATSIGCFKGYARPIEILLEKGADPFISNKGACPALICVVAKNQKENSLGALAILKLFQQRASTLYQAVQCLDIEKVKQFANADTIKNSEECPLSLSFAHWEQGIHESLPVIEILLTQGANPNAQLKNQMPGMTFLMLSTRHALKTGDTRLIELCLKHKGNPKYKAFPMALSAIDLVKVAAQIEPNNSHIPKIRSILNTEA